MKLHEFQAKELFSSFHIPVHDFEIFEDVHGVEQAAARFGPRVVIKAQVLTGGRGKAGGVQIASCPEEAVLKANEILALTIKGNPVNKIMVAPAMEIEKEYYLGIILDRGTKAITCMFSDAGGIDIEELAKTRPRAIKKLPILPDKGIHKHKLSRIINDLFRGREQQEQADAIVKQMYKLFIQKDCSLVEINPLALVNNRLLALDAKITFDDNALFKHPDIEELWNPEEYSMDEIEAKKRGLSFVHTGGTIGCIVNGAGLAMATMDIIKLYQGNPANFLDVGGSSNPEKVLHALKIILGNKEIKAILINIFGGITRCDDIAKGIIMAVKELKPVVPLVIRLIGTNDEPGREMLNTAGFPVTEHLGEAVEKVVSLAGKGEGHI